MIDPDSVEAASRRFCSAMSIRPDDSTKFKGRKLKNWQIAANQIHQHLALTIACRELLDSGGPQLVREN